MREPARWSEYRFFSRREFICPCCGDEQMDHRFLLRLDALRESYGKPINISSGYRCPDHNSAISSTGRNGPHTTGLAADIPCSHGDAYSILHLACNMGMFEGIGINQKGTGRFIHLDMTTKHRPTIWTY